MIEENTSFQRWGILLTGLLLVGLLGCSEDMPEIPPGENAVTPAYFSIKNFEILPQVYSGEQNGDGIFETDNFIFELEYNWIVCDRGMRPLQPQPPTGSELTGMQLASQRLSADTYSFEARIPFPSTEVQILQCHQAGVHTLAVFGQGLAHLRDEAASRCLGQISKEFPGLDDAGLPGLGFVVEDGSRPGGLLDEAGRAPHTIRLGLVRCFAEQLLAAPARLQQRHVGQLQQAYPQEADQLDQLA